MELRKRLLGWLTVLAMLCSTIVGLGNTTAFAAGTVDITLHKLKFSTDQAKVQNTGEVMTFPGSSPFPGVEFKIYNVTEAFYNTINTAGKTMDDAMTAAKGAASATTLVNVATTDSNGLIQFTGLPDQTTVSGKAENSVYVIVESPMAGVTPEDPLLVALPLDDPSNSGTPLTDIHLYPKNTVATAGVTVKKVSALDSSVLAGAEFVIHKDGLYGASGTSYLKEIDSAGNPVWSTNKADANVYTTDTNGEFKEENLLYGTYYYTEITAPTGYAIENGAVNQQFTLDASNKAATFTAENDDIVVDKTNTGGSINVGDKESYVVTLQIPNGIKDLLADGSPRYTKFELKDTHSNVLDLDTASLTLSDGTTTFTTPADYALSQVAGTPDSTFTVAFTPAGIAKMAPGATLTMNYDMELLQGAVPGVDYGNEINVKTDYDEDTDQGEDVYTGGYNFIKKDASNNNNPLAGAEFVVRDADNAGANYLKLGTNGEVSWSANVADAYRFTSATDGKIVIKGLEDGTYFLEETKAPSDKYVLLTARISFAVTKTSFDNTATALVDIMNTQKGFLPSTGGAGVYAVMLAGAFVMAATLLLYFRSKRKEA